MNVFTAGPGLDRLVITSAQGGDGESPDAGRRFTARVGASGQPVAPWAGPVAREP